MAGIEACSCQSTLPAVQQVISTLVVAPCLGLLQGEGGDIKQFMGSPVWCPIPPEGWGYLANVRHEAPCRFSGYAVESEPLVTPTLLATEALGYSF